MTRRTWDKAGDNSNRRAVEKAIRYNQERAMLGSEEQRLIRSEAVAKMADLLGKACFFAADGKAPAVAVFFYNTKKTEEENEIEDEVTKNYLNTFGLGLRRGAGVRRDRITKDIVVPADKLLRNAQRNGFDVSEVAMRIGVELPPPGNPGPGQE